LMSRSSSSLVGGWVLPWGRRAVPHDGLIRRADAA
jgi:hypothetical protein